MKKNEITDSLTVLRNTLHESLRRAMCVHPVEDARIKQIEAHYEDEKAKINIPVMEKRQRVAECEVLLQNAKHELTLAEAEAHRQLHEWAANKAEDIGRVLQGIEATSEKQHEAICKMIIKDMQEQSLVTTADFQQLKEFKRINGELSRKNLELEKAKALINTLTARLESLDCNIESKAKRKTKTTK